MYVFWRSAIRDTDADTNGNRNINLLSLGDSITLGLRDTVTLDNGNGLHDALGNDNPHRNFIENGIQNSLVDSDEILAHAFNIANADANTDFSASDRALNPTAAWHCANRQWLSASGRSRGFRWYPIFPRALASSRGGPRR